MSNETPNILRGLGNLRDELERISPGITKSPKDRTIERLQAEIATLRDELAQARAWEVLPDGQYGSLLVEDDGDSIAVALYEDDGQRYWQGCGLNGEFRVMRRAGDSRAGGWRE